MVGSALADTVWSALSVMSCSAFRDQSLIGIQVIAAPGLSQDIAVFVPVLFLPDAAVKRVVAVASNQVVAAVLDFDKTVLGIVDILRHFTDFGLADQVAGIVIVITGGVKQDALVGQSVVGIVIPGASHSAVLGAVADRI